MRKLDLLYSLLRKKAKDRTNPHIYIDFFKCIKDEENIAGLSLTRISSFTSDWSMSHVSNENKIIIHRMKAGKAGKVLIRVLNHEYLHAVLFRLEGQQTCRRLDRMEYGGKWWVN